MRIFNFNTKKDKFYYIKLIFLMFIIILLIFLIYSYFFYEPHDIIVQKKKWDWDFENDYLMQLPEPVNPKDRRGDWILVGLFAIISFVITYIISEGE